MILLLHCCKGGKRGTISFSHSKQKKGELTHGTKTYGPGRVGCRSRGAGDHPSPPPDHPPLPGGGSGSAPHGGLYCRGTEKAGLSAPGSGRRPGGRHHRAEYRPVRPAAGGHGRTSRAGAERVGLSVGQRGHARMRPRYARGHAAGCGGPAAQVSGAVKRHGKAGVPARRGGLHRSEGHAEGGSSGGAQTPGGHRPACKFGHALRHGAVRAGDVYGRVYPVPRHRDGKGLPRGHARDGGGPHQHCRPHLSGPAGAGQPGGPGQKPRRCHRGPVPGGRAAQRHPGPGGAGGDHPHL